MTAAPNLGQPTELQVAFRGVMASVCTPVPVVTATTGGQPHGTTVSAFPSLSSLIRETERFGSNVLGGERSSWALKFARKGGVGTFAGVPWQIEVGVPRIPGAGGFLACRAAQLVDGGDHGRVFGTHVALAQQA